MLQQAKELEMNQMSLNISQILDLRNNVAKRKDGGGIALNGRRKSAEEMPQATDLSFGHNRATDLSSYGGYIPHHNSAAATLMLPSSSCSTSPPSQSAATMESSSSSVIAPLPLLLTHNKASPSYMSSLSPTSSYSSSSSFSSCSFQKTDCRSIVQENNAIVGGCRTSAITIGGSSFINNNMVNNNNSSFIVANSGGNGKVYTSSKGTKLAFTIENLIRNQAESDIVMSSSEQQQDDAADNASSTGGSSIEAADVMNDDDDEDDDDYDAGKNSDNMDDEEKNFDEFKR